MRKISDEELKKMTEDVIINLYSYIKITNVYIQNHIIIEEMLHVGLLLDNMTEQIDKIASYYCSIFKA